MWPSLMHSVREALDRPWVLGIDASIKPLYRRQEGAEIGYNPTKLMRPQQLLGLRSTDGSRCPGTRGPHCTSPDCHRCPPGVINPP
jgi:hypothetical protein